MFNHRAACAAVMERVAEEDPWFGIEQEYYILDPATKWPLGWSGYFDPKTTDIQTAAVELTKNEASTCHPSALHLTLTQDDLLYKYKRPGKCHHSQGICM